MFMCRKVGTSTPSWLCPTGTISVNKPRDLAIVPLEILRDYAIDAPDSLKN